MKSALIIFILFVIVGCGQRDTALRQKITGTWGLATGRGVITIAPDGSLLSRFTNSTQVLTYEGTWRLRGEQIVFKTTKSNSIPLNDVMRARIVRADGLELVYELNHQTISLSRK